MASQAGDSERKHGPVRGMRGAGGRPVKSAPLVRTHPVCRPSQGQGYATNTNPCQQVSNPKHTGWILLSSEKRLTGTACETRGGPLAKDDPLRRRARGGGGRIGGRLEAAAGVCEDHAAVRGAPPAHLLAARRVHLRRPAGVRVTPTRMPSRTLQLCISHTDERGVAYRAAARVDGVALAGDLDLPRPHS